MGLEVELDLYLYLYLYHLCIPIPIPYAYTYMPILYHSYVLVTRILIPLMLIPLTPTSIYLSIYLSIYRYNMEGVWDWKLGKFRQKFSNVRSLVA